MSNQWKAEKSKGEAALAMMLKVYRIDFEREYQWHPFRKWRSDFVLLRDKIIIEIEGGIWAGGRHTRGKGFEDDCWKYNSAALLGWRVLRYSTGMVISGEAIAQIAEYVQGVERIAVPLPPEID